MTASLMGQRANARNATNGAQTKPQGRQQHQTPSQRAADPVFQCKTRIRNRELHDVCAKNKDCDLRKKCGRQRIGDQEIETLGSKDWELGDPSKWEEVREKWKGEGSTPERKKAFRETNECIRRVLHENHAAEYQKCNELGEPRSNASRSPNAAKPPNNGAANAKTSNAAPKPTNAGKSTNAAAKPKSVKPKSAKATNVGKAAAAASNASKSKKAT